VTVSSAQVKHYTQNRRRSVRQRTLTKGHTAPQTGGRCCTDPEMPQNRWQFSRAVWSSPTVTASVKKDAPAAV
jgi:hypothetical protein